MLICFLCAALLCICIWSGSIMLSKTCWESNYLSEPPMQWGGLLSLKHTEINISALEKKPTIIPRHGGNRPEPNVCSNVGTHKWHSSQLHIKRFPSTWFWLGQNPEKKKKRVTAEMSSIIGAGKCKQPTLCCRALICLCNCEMVSFEETRYKMLSILNSIWKQLLHVSCCNHILEAREPLLGLFFFFINWRTKLSWHCEIKVRLPVLKQSAVHPHTNAANRSLAEMQIEEEKAFDWLVADRMTRHTVLLAANIL